MLQKLRLFISHLFIAIWAYFPIIIITGLLYKVFWKIGQGRDLIFAQTNNKNESWLFILAALFLFYTCWHSAEIIGINKVKRITSYKPSDESTADLIGKKMGTYPSKKFFGTVSIILAYIIYSIIIASFFRIEGYTTVTPNKTFFILYFLVFFTLQYSFFVLLNKINPSNDLQHPHNKYIYNLFIVIAILAIGYYLVQWFVLKSATYYSIPITGVLTVFLVQLIRKTLLIHYNPSTFTTSSFKRKILNFYGIQDKYAASFLIFNIIGISVFFIYVVCIASIQTAQTLGPLSFLLMAIGIILGVINLIIFLSIKIGFNIYVFILLFALLFGQTENHYVQTTELSENYRDTSITLIDQLEKFTQQFDANADYEIPMYFILANGGASRAGWWTGGLLAHLETSTQFKSEKSFYQHVFAISSASGGSIGSAAFLYHQKSKESNTPLFNIVRKTFEKDLLTPGLSYFLSFDLGRYLLPIAFTTTDRNHKLEQAFEEAMGISDRQIPIQYLFKNDAYNYSPLFAFNVTRMQDGSPGVVTNLKYDAARFNNRVNVIELFHPDTSLTLSAGAFLSARFPYISPAGRIDASNGSVQYFVDGGYFDNSGAGFIQEIMVEIQSLLHQHPKFESYKNRINFHVIHIKNSSTGIKELNETAPIENDLLSPIITIMGAYDMQTNTNDYRLVNFIRDRGYTYDTLTLVDEQRFRYPMNWVLSDFVMKRMDSMIQVQSAIFKNKYGINRF